MVLLLYMPKYSKRPVPAFLGLNFYGNYTIYQDLDINITDLWVRKDGKENKAQGRGVDQEAWPIEVILDRGYVIAAAYYYGDLMHERKEH